MVLRACRRCISFWLKIPSVSIAGFSRKPIILHLNQDLPQEVSHMKKKSKVWEGGKTSVKRTHKYRKAFLHLHL